MSKKLIEFQGFFEGENGETLRLYADTNKALSIEIPKKVIRLLQRFSNNTLEYAKVSVQQDEEITIIHGEHRMAARARAFTYLEALDRIDFTLHPAILALINRKPTYIGPPRVLPWVECQQVCERIYESRIARVREKQVEALLLVARYGPNDPRASYALAEALQMYDEAVNGLEDCINQCPTDLFRSVEEIISEIVEKYPV